MGLKFRVLERIQDSLFRRMRLSKRGIAGVMRFFGQVRKAEETAIAHMKKMPKIHSAYLDCEGACEEEKGGKKGEFAEGLPAFFKTMMEVDRMEGCNFKNR
jgi:hypothetical protein